jgi:hypothetical protein
VGIAYLTSAPSGGFTVNRGSAGNAGKPFGMATPADSGVSADTQKFLGQ